MPEREEARAREIAELKKEFQHDGSCFEHDAVIHRLLRYCDEFAALLESRWLSSNAATALYCERDALQRDLAQAREEVEAEKKRSNAMREGLLAVDEEAGNIRTENESLRAALAELRRVTGMIQQRDPAIHHQFAWSWIDELARAEAKADQELKG